MSSLSKSNSDSRVYVGNLPQNVRQRDIEDHFDKYGKVRGIDIHSRFDPAFAFIEFEDSRDAEDAVYGEDGKRFDSNRIKVQFPRGTPKGASGGGRREGGGGGGGGYTRGRGGGRSGGGGQPIRRTDHRILVSGLPSSGSWQDLKDHMREAGEVVYADVYKDGTAVCEFKSYDDMKWALKNLDDTKFKSHENETSYIRIKKDDPSGKSRGRTRSRSPQRSRSKSRSRSPRKSRSQSRSKSPAGKSASRSRSRSRSR